jgi:3-oxoacyl-[acyl-carrier protein] reductase
MDLLLAGHNALITGASSGIGAAAARLLAAEGMNIAVGYHENRSGAEQTAQAVRDEERQAWLVQMDVANPDAVENAVRELAPQIAGLDLLVLCAGRNIITPLEEITPQEWTTILDVNLNGAFYVLQAVLPFLNEGSAVVTVSSVAAHTGAPHHAHYAAAKAGLINLTKSAARALSPRVRVNCVAPGITRTEMGENTISSLPDDYAERKLLTDRYGTPEEIAACIAFLASPRAGFITGATLDASGGRVLR